MSADTNHEEGIEVGQARLLHRSSEGRARGSLSACFELSPTDRSEPAIRHNANVCSTSTLVFPTLFEEASRKRAMASEKLPQQRLSEACQQRGDLTTRYDDLAPDSHLVPISQLAPAEQALHPLFKTSPCVNRGWPGDDVACPKGPGCPYAHGADELREAPVLTPQGYRYRLVILQEGTVVMRFEGGQERTSKSDAKAEVAVKALAELPSLPTAKAVLKATQFDKRAKSRMCRFIEEGSSCFYGNKCDFAHSKTELRIKRHGPLAKTKMCNRVIESGTCHLGEACGFAHSKSEMSQASTFTKLAHRCRLIIQEEPKLRASESEEDWWALLGAVFGAKQQIDMQMIRDNFGR